MCYHIVQGAAHVDKGVAFLFGKKGFTNIPFINCNLTGEQVITQMLENNTTQRESMRLLFVPEMSAAGGGKSKTEETDEREQKRKALRPLRKVERVIGSSQQLELPLRKYF